MNAQVQDITVAETVEVQPFAPPTTPDPTAEALKLAEEALQRGIEIVVAMHQNDPSKPIADNGMTVWDAILSDTARWGDNANVALAAIRKITGGTK